MNQSQVDLVHLEMIKRRRQNSDFPADAADTDARVELIWSFGELNEIKGFDGIFHKLDPFLPPIKLSLKFVLSLSDSTPSINLHLYYLLSSSKFLAVRLLQRIQTFAFEKTSEIVQILGTMNGSICSR